jgi:hypothetical protein
MLVTRDLADADNAETERWGAGHAERHIRGVGVDRHISLSCDFLLSDKSAFYRSRARLSTAKPRSDATGKPMEGIMTVISSAAGV